MNMIGSGSLIAARQSPLPYTALAAAGILIGLFFLIWIFWRIQKKRRETPEFIEAEKHRPTALKDVRTFAKKLDLSAREITLLFNICSREQCPNICYSWTDSQMLDCAFKNEYIRMKESRKTEEEIKALFLLKSRIERKFITTKALSSTHLIPQGEYLIFTSETRIEYRMKILKSDSDNIILEIPFEFENTEFCPKPLSKIRLTYYSPLKLKHIISTRVIRFQKGFDDTNQMVIQQSNTVSMQSRRRYKRSPLNLLCTFRSVEEREGTEGKKYIPKENRYEGEIADISAGGCMLKTNLPIKQDQKLWMEIELPEGIKIELCGLIVAVNQRPDLYLLHIKFLNLAPKDMNSIFSFVYNF